MITSEIIGYEEDSLKNIIIWICFKDNSGEEIPFRRNGEILIYEGKKAWPLYSIYQNFLEKDLTQIEKWIRINVEHQIENIVQEEAKIVRNPLVQVELENLIGTVFFGDSVEIPIDPDVTGVDTGTVILKDDGSYTVI